MAFENNRFPSLPREGPQKRPAADRIAEFREIEAVFAQPRGRAQASRCAGCGVPFCQSACPLHNDIPDWLNLASAGRYEEAWARASATSTMPEICGRICPQDRLCEGACVLDQSGWEGVTIGSVEKWLGEMAWREGWVAPITPLRERARSVGIIGAGPAAIAAADRLREQGWAVTMYDRHDRPGGLLIYGIPEFKLEKQVVRRRTERLAQSGVRFVQDCEVGRDRSFAEVRAGHDAVLIATGVYRPRRLSAPGVGSAGVVAALDFLTTANRVCLGEQPQGFASGRLNAEGRDVVVIGGGDTAMDCVRTAVRQGARSVICLYRRDRANMPGSAREVGHAEEEGVRFEWLSAPKAILGDAGRVSGVRAVRMRLGAPGPDGRRHPEETPGSDFTIAADLVIEALGFEPEDLPTLFTEPALPVKPDGTIAISHGRTGTALPGVFAAGDIVRGASLVVWAARDGQDAAAEIHAYLEALERAPAIAAE